MINWFKKLTPGKKWFAFMTVFAFASVICFFNVDSYWADTHHANGKLIVAGILLGLTAIFGLYKVATNSNTGLKDGK